MAKVLLVNPRDEYIEKDGGMIGDRPPLGLLSISAYLKKYGHEVEVLDMNHRSAFDYSYSSPPELICFSIATPNYHSSLDIVTSWKNMAKDNPHFHAKFIAGGNHVTDFPHQKETLETFDYIVQGDGEQAVLDIIEKNITAEEGKIIKRELKDVDIIPDYDAVDMSKYTMQVDGLPGAMIVTARGCLYNCCYCGSAKHKKLREREWTSIIKEMDILYRRYGKRGFYFGDDIFTFNKQRTMILCHSIKLRFQDTIKFRCTTRADLLDEETIIALKDAGCTIVCLGIESGSDKVLKAMNKGMTVEQQRKAIQLCKQYGLKVKSFYIFPLPGDTLDTFEETLAFAKDMDTEYCDMYELTPYPSTPLWDHPERFGMEIYKPTTPEEWNEYNQIQVKKSKPLFKHPNLTQEQIEMCIRRFKDEIKKPGVTY